MKRKSKSNNGGYSTCIESQLHKSLTTRNLTEKARKRTRKRCLKTCCCNYRPDGIKPPDEGPSQYIIYCIVNTGFFMNRGILAASVARAFLGLYDKVDRNRVKAEALDSWEDAGEPLVVLKGINHKHLRFLAEELHYAAVETFALHKTWGKNSIMLVLSTLGREEDLEEVLDGLSYLK